MLGEKVTTIDDFTAKERVRALEMLIEKNISYAIEFAYILKKHVSREKSQILGELIRCLKIDEEDKAKEWLEKYKLLEEK